ncbi:MULTISPECIES: FAS1-like dehydratase domain-containing protein [Frigoribacterium]|uniref:FAS1-like dehydratase domain-containing protein n=1 Tax=Frigoribacterium TaxID=96492 RepID=UPI00156763F1|nr:MaoC family dehydratase N-terminal domain-containing protein [Frigoribacterium faeni]MBD8486541.1 MaoC family dehydratase N-terminal domain-containing protein [Frigoribacterium sp. CFBP 8759]NQW86645.1 MaoC family dehydratase N-terminal domain-containing protein [Frigoribacterium sp. VKM Ac-2860]NQX07976.1 MaoC family dehydratase N-terminal domain-containing protein [Frigoribacterium sp. VKM Ac-2859]
MSVNPDLQGRVFPPAPPYLVGREKVREFARATGSTSPLSFDVEAAHAAGHGDLVAPPTFAVVVQEATLAQLLAEPDAGIDFSRVVHGEQRFSLSRPIVAGDELTATLTVTSVKTLGGNAMVTASSDMRDVDGRHVVTAVSTLVVRADDEAAA